MNFDNLPDRLRLAGVAWVVEQSFLWSEPADTHKRAHHWAIIRGLPLESEVDHHAAALDAMRYAADHAEDVHEFLAYRDRERRRNEL